ncbi:hypothetical protein HC928_08190 [bacterium]|nr:hypothetical protein [bacterium]
MAKTNRELPPDKLLERVLAVAKLLAAPPDDTSENGQSALPSVTPIVNQTASRRKTRPKNRDDRS